MQQGFEKTNSSCPCGCKLPIFLWRHSKWFVVLLNGGAVVTLGYHLKQVQAERLAVAVADSIIPG